MKKLFFVALLAVMACGSVAEPALDQGNEPNDGIPVQYIVLGDAFTVSVGFCSDLSPEDTLTCAVLPLLYEFTLQKHDKAFIRVHKNDPDDVVSVGIVVDGWFHAVDTARPGDPMAEVYWEL